MISLIFASFIGKFLINFFKISSKLSLSWILLDDIKDLVYFFLINDVDGLSLNGLRSVLESVKGIGVEIIWLGSLFSGTILEVVFSILEEVLGGILLVLVVMGVVREFVVNAWRLRIEFGGTIGLRLFDGLTLVLFGNKNFGLLFSI